MRFSASMSTLKSWSNCDLNLSWYQGPSKRSYAIAHRSNTCIAELLRMSPSEIRRSNRVKWCWRGSVPPTVTRHNSPNQTTSISDERQTGILPLDMASHFAIGSPWHGWKPELHLPYSFSASMTSSEYLAYLWQRQAVTLSLESTTSASPLVPARNAEER